MKEKKNAYIKKRIAKVYSIYQNAYVIYPPLTLIRDPINVISGVIVVLNTEGCLIF